MTVFIQDSGYHYLARDKNGEAVGIVFVPKLPEEIVVGVRVVGRQGCSFELLNEAEVGTYREFELVPDLRYMDRQKVTVNTASGVEVISHQLNYAVPGEDYDRNSTEARSVNIPPGVLSISGMVGRNKKQTFNISGTTIIPKPSGK